MPEKALYITVYGRVQGVFFRAYTAEKAKSLGIKGFVKNMPDGSVQIYAEGDEDLLKKFINHVKKGPPLAIVESVDIQEVEPQDAYKDFTIAY